MSQLALLEDDLGFGSGDYDEEDDNASQAHSDDEAVADYGRESYLDGMPSLPSDKQAHHDEGTGALPEPWTCTACSNTLSFVTITVPFVKKRSSNTLIS